MRVGVNGQRLSGQRLGIGRYIEYMLQHWVPLLDAQDVVEVFTQDPVSTDGLPKSDRVRFTRLTPHLTGALWENMVLPRVRPRVDVLFGPSYTLPAAYPGPCAVAIHSVNERAAGAHEWWYNLTWGARYRLSVRRAAMVIVPTETTRQDVMAEYGLAEDRVAIVDHGVDDAFKPVVDPEVRRSIRMRYLGADRPYVIFVGKLSQRRNIRGLMQAFRFARDEYRIPHALLLFGPNHMNLPLASWAQELGIASDVVQDDGRVAVHADLAAVYGSADLYASASLYEGASLTVLEAMACGLPVVVPDIASLSEAAKGYGVVVEGDPAQDEFAEAMGAAMGELLTDEPRRRSMGQRCRERGASFRWEDAARATLDVLRKVANDA